MAGFPPFCSGALIFKEAERWNPRLSIHLQKENQKKFLQSKICGAKRNYIIVTQLELVFPVSSSRVWVVSEKILNCCWKNLFSFLLKLLSLTFIDTVHHSSYSSATRFLILHLKSHIDLIYNMYFWIFSIKGFPPLVKLHQIHAACKLWRQH